MKQETRILDNRTFLLGLDQLYRNAMKRHEQRELLGCARTVCHFLNLGPASVPIEGYYNESPELTEYFGLVRALQQLSTEVLPKLSGSKEFERLYEVASSPIFGRSRGLSPLPGGFDPLSEALTVTFPNWTVENLTATARTIAKESGDFSLVGLAALAGEATVLAALRESCVLYAEAVAGCAFLEPIEPVYVWQVDPEISERACRFVATFNSLFGESLPTPAPDEASQFWEAAADAHIFGRCVRLGWDDRQEPFRQYHWAIVHDREKGLKVIDFWSDDVWTTERSRIALFERKQLPWGEEIQ